MLRALSARSRQPPEDRTPDEDGACSQSERLERICPPAHTAIQIDLASARHGVDDLWQRLDGCGHRIELTTAVVRDENPRDAALGALVRILRRQDALERQRQRRDRAQPLYIGPGNRRAIRCVI